MCSSLDKSLCQHLETCIGQARSHVHQYGQTERRKAGCVDEGQLAQLPEEGARTTHTKQIKANVPPAFKHLTGSMYLLVINKDTPEGATGRTPR